MQNIQSMGGGGGDRRLRPHHKDAAALKCPRCDSSNTKFCYYNNYNLSQPRHFCKSCRRYWTRGGVLRNIPVGGGCRKTKRSNKHDKTTPYPESAIVKKSSSDSSSESSNIIRTATTAKAASVQPLHAVSPNSNSNMETGFVSPGCGLFGDMESLTNLIGSGDEAVGFGFGDMLDQTVGVDLGGDVGEYGSSDWQSGEGVFDLTETVDQAYWSQTGDDQWSDQGL